MSTKNEIFEYVMNSPEDTNAAVLTSLLNGLETGGGGGGDASIAEILQGTIKEISNDEATSVIKNGCSYFTGLTKVDLPNVKTIGDSAFQTCTALAEVNLPELTTAGTSAFAGCAALKEISLPKLTAVSTAMFSGSGLETLDLGVATVIGVSSLSSCAGLDTIVLRSSTLCELEYGSPSILGGTCFDSDGTGGTLYVPQALISSYEAASGWSTILGYTNNQILAIEGSEFA